MIFKHESVILPLYKSLVKPLLEYAVQCWSPHHAKYIEILERVQRRATKMIPSLRNLPYNLRLKKLRLQTLELRRLRGQLIEVFKILKGFDKVNNVIFRDDNIITRNNEYKLKGKRFRIDIVIYFFC